MAPTKLVFVTVGATASFPGLLRAVLSHSFLKSLLRHKYTHLRIQSGKDGTAVLEESLRELLPDRSTPQLSDEAWVNVHGIYVSAFPFKDGLTKDYKSAREGKHEYIQSLGDGIEGAVMSHAGSGSILEALRVDVPIIVVPNTALLDNHQSDLANELAKQGYIVHGRLDKLDQALGELENLREKKRKWPPSKQEEGMDEGRGLMGVMDDEMGFVD